MRAPATFRPPLGRTAAAAFVLAAVAQLARAAAAPVAEWTLSDWSARAFAELPCREGAAPPAAVDGDAALSLLSWADVVALRDAFVAAVVEPLLQPTAWPLDGAEGAARAGRLRNPAAIVPYVLRVLVPAGSTVFVFGDLHGSLHSLLRELASLRRRGALGDDLRLAPGAFVLTLGDYVDRGPHGVEVLAVLLALRARNPGRVWQARGNHEDVTMNAREAGGTFRAELRAKFPGVPGAELDAVVSSVYAALPPAIFLGVRRDGGGEGDGDAAAVGAGVDYLLCVHGGIEVGWDPAPLLRAAGAGAGGGAGGAAEHAALVRGLRRGDWLRAPANAAARAAIPRPLHSLFTDYGAPPVGSGDGEALVGAAGPVGAPSAPPQPPAQAYPVPPTATRPFLQWMWGDFFVHDARPALGYREGRGLIFGRALTTAWLRAAGVAAVLRAHQHNDAPAAGPMMSAVRGGAGVFDNWNGSGAVLTWLSGAHIPRMAFPRDAYGALALRGPAAADWRMELCGQAVGEPVPAGRGDTAAAGAGGRRASARGRAARRRLVCDATEAVTCAPLPWRAYGVHQSSADAPVEPARGAADDGARGLDVAAVAALDAEAETAARRFSH